MLGPITTFDGIPFGPGHLYSYLEAKLLLRQAIALLRERPRVKALGVDQKFPGRKSITGKDGTAVWDLLSLRPADSSDNFTTWPHLTLGIHADKTNPMITVPNGIKGSCRQAIKNLGTDGFIDLCMEVVNEARHNFGKQSGYIPVLRVVQRHYLGQRRAVIDGDTHVDLRITTGDAKGGIKRQTHWLTAAHQIATDRQGANVQLQFGVWFPHEDGLLRKINPLEGIESAWESCKPVLDVLMGRR